MVREEVVIKRGRWNIQKFLLECGPVVINGNG